MKPETQSKLALFVANVQAISKAKGLKWNDGQRLAALLHALDGKEVDCDGVRGCLGLIKSKTSMISYFRGHMELPLAALLTLSDDPPRLLDETLSVYEMLKNAKLGSSDYLVMAAYLIAKQVGSANCRSVISRARAFYDGMKAKHFWLTSEDDYIYTAMLGLSELNATVGVERIERLYQRFKGEFNDKNSVQALVQVLTLGDARSEEERRTIALRDEMKARKIRLYKDYALPILGVFALLPVDVGTVASDVAEADAFLREQKGFGALSVDERERLVLAAALVADGYAADMKDDFLSAAVSTSITNIIIAQQIMAIIIIYSASNVAAVAASTSSSS